MATTIVWTKAFSKELKRQQKRGKNLAKLKTFLKILTDEKAPPKKYRDHSLIGNFKGCRECHIEPDWLLIYTKKDKNITLERTGSHSDLFK